MDKKFTSFLKEYKALCEKHQIIISSCECCDSPSMDKITPKDDPDWDIWKETVKSHVTHLQKYEDEGEYYPR